MDSKTEEIHVILDSLSNTDPEITHSALSMLVQKMRASTSVASTIPQILLYLVSQRVVLQDKLVTLSGENRMLMADILSVISATLATTESLKYRLEGGATPMDIWGHQYVKKLSCDIVKSLKAHRMAGGSLGQEESNLSEMIATAAKESASMAKHSHGAENRAVGDEKVTEKEEVSEEEILPITEEMADPLEKVIEGVVECMFKFNCECDCVDFLLEIDRIEMILNYIDIDNQERIIRYLNALVYFVRNEKVTNTFLELLKRNGN